MKIITKIKLAVGLVIIILSSCSSLEDPENVKPDDILHLNTIGKNVLRADGKDQTIIIARIPKEAGLRDIQFRTTAGIFIFSGIKEVKELADSISGDYRYATTIIRSDTVENIAYITAEVSNARQRFTLPFIK